MDAGEHAISGNTEPSPHARTGPGRSSRPAGRFGRPAAADRIPWIHAGIFVAGAVLVILFTWHQIATERETALTHWKSRLATVASDRARLVSGWLTA